jgi:hypothetical protein
MPVLQNARHELFAKALAGGKNASEAYRLAGYVCAPQKARGHGHRLRTREDVAARIQELVDKPQNRIATQQIVEAIRTGRPTIYRPELATHARKLALLGATEAQMADALNINVSTLSDWMHKHSEFSRAIKSGKVQADAEVAERLYSRATGHSHEAVKIFLPAGATAPVYAPFTAHYPPDTKAALAWLSRRQPELWRATERLDLNVKGSLTHRLNQMTLEERGALAVEVAAKIRQRLADAGIMIEHEPAREEDEK